MLFVQGVIAAFMASAAMALAVPIPDSYDLKVGSDQDYGAEYQASPLPVESFLCVRDGLSMRCIPHVAAEEPLAGNTKREFVETFECKAKRENLNHSFSCLRRRDAADETSLHANVERETEPVESFACKRDGQVLSCLPKEAHDPSDPAGPTNNPGHSRSSNLSLA
ncbi:hypothetical protein B0T16DRAFT_410694 [Cercophora newfieldiana]|uniref:Uncharacterized protein n=1 Tax=Cercophora newfieldiana TaxID=92897 RepID=A0AA39YBV2_9PEZI|nr:hypothetical protein B0T16DRAFT_410694 [Cercophora newfieldiana]